MKSLKSKITLIYICLIITIALVGITAVINLYSLTNSIDNLLTANYNSINAANNMMYSLDDQNSAIFDYIHMKKQDGIDNFYKSNTDFYKWYNLERANFTEKGEKELVDKINIDYVKYVKLFSEIQEIRNNNGMNQSIRFYNTTITPVYKDLKKDLRNLSSLNETGMRERKTKLTQSSQKSMYLILLISIIAVIVSFFFSRFFTNKFLYPVYCLTETVKSVKEGNLNKQTSVLSNDEIGILAEEFNKMITRLEKFEHSTKGKLMTEMNKSLAIVKSISDPLIVLDSNYKIILLNNACEDFFKIHEANVIDNYYMDAIENNDLHGHITAAFQSQNYNKSKIIHFYCDGKDYYFNVIATVVKDNTSSNKIMVVLFQNITQLKEIEKIKTDFISTISHEFKTPLTSIMMGTSLIEDENIGELNEKQSRIIDTIKEDGEKLTSLVTNLLQLSKIEWNKSIFNIEPCSILGIVDTCIKGFYDQADAKDINLFAEIDELLPKVSADSEKITWVIDNLLSNAFKYTNAGDEISIKAFIEHGKMCVSVSDTGAGIPPEYLPKIFDKFVQIKGSDSEIRGTGLGLAIAKEIIEAHNGEIWCESELDLGSTFTFTLPLAHTI